jgi:predicted metalloprotease with PDZ domain
MATMKQKTTDKQAHRSLSTRNVLLFSSVSMLMYAILVSCAQMIPINSSAAPTQIAQGLSVAPVLGVVVNKSFTVLSVDPGGAAENAGVKSGDILLSVQGIGFSDGFSAKSAIGAIAPGEKVTLKFIRDGKEAQIDVVSQNRTFGNIKVTVTPISEADLYF